MCKCLKCGIDQSNESYKNFTLCKKCYMKDYSAKYYIKNKEKIKERVKKYKKANDVDRKYHERHKDRLNEISRLKHQSLKNNEEYKIKRKKWQETYYKKHSKEAYIRCVERRARKLKRTPKWANLKTIREFYKNCPEGYEVDHIIPLQGKNISGLHVLENLQYLLIKENRIKHNSFDGTLENNSWRNNE